MDKESEQFKQAPGLEVHETEDGLIAFNPATDRVHHLNHTAGVIFGLCEKPITLSELVEQTAQLYALEESPREAIATGLRQLLDEGVVLGPRVE